MDRNSEWWRNGNFLGLIMGAILSALGDAAIFILLAWYVIDVTGSEGMLGTALMVMALPRLVFMLVGGVVSDRFQQKNVMALSALARAVVLLLYSLFLLGNQPEWMMPALFAMAALFGVVDAFFYPARSSIMPFVVAKEHLAAANSVIGTAQQISTVTGPVLAALLLQSDSYPLMFAVIGLFFLIASLVLVMIRQNPREGTGGKGEDVPIAAAVRELGEGLRYVRTIPMQIILMGVSMGINLMWMGPVYISLPVMIKEMGWSGEAFGYLEGALGAGAILGGIIAGVANGFRGRMMVIPCFLIGLGLGEAALGLMEALPFGLTVMFLLGMMLSLTDIPIITYMQTVIEPRYLGRVMSLQSMMSMGLIPVSYALVSFFLEHQVLPTYGLMMTGGFFIALLGVSLWSFRHFRQMEQHPAWIAANERASA